MLHLQRISKGLNRFILLLFLIQLVIPAFALAATLDSSIQHKVSFSIRHDSGIAVAVFLKENTEEKNETTEKVNITPELIDFSFLVNALKQSHSPIHWDTHNLRLISEPLFKLFCIFLI
jgi:hypothetical protein